jgi:hypothetical protein
LICTGRLQLSCAGHYCLQVSARAGTGKLQELSIPEMQCRLKSHKLPVGGKKSDLEARILNALGLVPKPDVASTQGVVANARGGAS